MEHYCDKCKVKVDGSQVFCPLCGRRCSKLPIGNDERYKIFPRPEYKNDTLPAVINKISIILLLATVICIAVELIVSGGFWWSAFVLASTVLFYCALLAPIKHRWTVAGSLANAYLFVGGYLLFLELMTKSYGWGVMYVIPLFIFAMSVVNVFIMLLKPERKWSYLLPLLVTFFLALTLFIYNWAAGSSVLWPSMAAFFFACAVLIYILIFRFRSFVRSMKKNFHA